MNAFFRTTQAVIYFSGDSWKIVSLQESTEIRSFGTKYALYLDLKKSLVFSFSVIEVLLFLCCRIAFRMYMRYLNCRTLKEK